MAKTHSGIFIYLSFDMLKCFCAAIKVKHCSDNTDTKLEICDIKCVLYV